MFKKSLTMITMLCAMVPVVASAASWSLATRVNTVGGTIASRNMAIQDSAKGTVLKNYTTHANVPVTITPATGYAIKSISVNGVALSPLPTSPVNMGLTVFPNKLSQGVVASFAAQTNLIQLTIAAGTGGTATPVGMFKVKPGSTAKVTFKANAGNTLASITNLPAGAVLTDATTGAVVGLPYSGAVKAEFAVPTAASTITGQFQTGILAAASASAASVLVGQTVTLNASASGTGGAATFAWTQTGGPDLGTPAIPWTATGAGPITTPALILPVTVPATDKAVYSFQVKATNAAGSSIAGVTVVVNRTAVVESTLQTVQRLCIDCHNNAGVGAAVPPATSVYQQWSTSKHKAVSVACKDCHAGADFAGAHPGTKQCSTCHAGVTPTVFASICSTCHGNGIHTVGSAAATGGCSTCHGAATSHWQKATGGCIGCHDVAINYAHSGSVNNNNGGVRAITNEFTKWSHHVTGVNLQNEHCAVCHLAGKSVNKEILVDSTKHMADNKIHLRNADDNSDMLWDPAAPSHTTMDNFCMSCHDANGASSGEIGKIIASATPAPGAVFNNGLNPFMDTISNKYDKMLRGRVVDAAGQFNTDNVSHHAVKGKKYSGRERSGTARVIASPSTFAQYSGLDAELAGERQTLYEAGRFVAAYTTLQDAAGESGARNGGTTLGDDSTLHCGDCHTVGQFKPGSSKNAAGAATTVVIGAHGSENEYLLRNSLGTDVLHRGAQYNYAPANMSLGAPFAGIKAADTLFGNNSQTQTNIANQAVPATEIPTAQPFLICYSCHVYQVYGSVYFSNTAAGGREGGHAEGDHTRGNYCNGPYGTSGSGRATTYTAVYGKYSTSANMMGTFQTITNFNFGRLQPATAAVALNGGAATAPPATAGMNGSGAGGANIFGIQCAHCHNSGANNGFGGIHGSKINTYTDGNGNPQNARRFLPGLGNVDFVPGDPTFTEAERWEQEAGTAGPGCYTLSTSTDSSAKNKPNPTTPEAGGTLNPGSGQMFGTWGACSDHGSGAGTKTGKAGDNFDRTIIRPVSY